ncbi:hypothetical protein, partial [Gordonia sp. NPDC003429]
PLTGLLVELPWCSHIRILLVRSRSPPDPGRFTQPAGGAQPAGDRLDRRVGGFDKLNQQEELNQRATGSTGGWWFRQAQPAGVGGFDKLNQQEELNQRQELNQRATAQPAG